MASGPAGEDAARRFAEARGYRTLARNVRTPFGELDLVLEDPEGVLVFAEVKARAALGPLEGAEAVTSRKRARLRRAALACAGALGRADAAMRFDVFSVASGGAIEHYVDAF